MLNLKRDKRGVMGIIIFFIMLFVILIVGFIFAITIGVIDFASDTVTPILTTLPEVGGVNISESTTATVGVVNNFVQATPWLLALGYVGALIFSIIFVSLYKTNPHPVFIGLYVMMMLLLIFGAVILSNAYEDIITPDNELSTRLNENVAMKYLIIYSPAILALISAIAGIYAFAQKEENTI